jgi:hypothetical protein
MAPAKVVHVGFPLASDDPGAGVPYFLAACVPAVASYATRWMKTYADS